MNVMVDDVVVTARGVLTSILRLANSQCSDDDVLILLKYAHIVQEMGKVVVSSHRGSAREGLWYAHHPADELLR
jgi:hypothetical protein